MQGVIYEEGSIWIFLFTTILIGGGAAWMTGRSVALNWGSLGLLVAAVVGLAPPYYPRSRLDSDRDGCLLGVVAEALGAAEARGLGRTTSRPFFPGISDMSFLYPEDDAAERLLASAACPLGLDPLPAGFSCPALNLGPWGREYHQRLERVHASYAFGTLPELLRLVAEGILAGE